MAAYRIKYKQISCLTGQYDEKEKIIINFKRGIRFAMCKRLFISESILMHRTLTIAYGSEPVRSSVDERLSVCLASRPMSTDIYGGT